MSRSHAKVDRTPSTFTNPAPASPAFASYFRFLAASKLTAADHRVLAYFIERFTQHRTLSEAVPIGYIAEQLGVSNNTVSRACANLTDLGLLQRTAVLHRGAPTRTTLAGVARALVMALCGIRASKEPSHPRPQLVALSGGRSEGCANPARADAGASAAPTSHLSAVPSPAPARAEKAHSTSRSPRPASYTRRFAFDPKIQQAMMSKLPDGLLYDLTSKRSGGALTVDPSWNLTDAETDHLLALMASHQQESAAAPVKTAPPRPALPALPAEIAKLAWQALPVLERTASAKRAGKLMDEIAYAVAHADLGRGDTAGGIRAALSMIRKGIWGTPKGMTGRWSGAVLRTVGDSHVQ